MTARAEFDAIDAPSPAAPEDPGPRRPRSRVGPAAAASVNRARLYLTRLDPWSAAKVGFMVSLALAVMLVVAVAASWWALSVTGVFEALARNLDDIIGSGTTTFDVRALLSFERVIGVALVVAALEVLLVSALSALLAVFYNLTVGLTGGVEVVLSDVS